MNDRKPATEYAPTEPGQSADETFDGLLREAARVTDTFATRAGSALGAGTRLASGRLTIVRPIGAGGMGVVYEAFDAERNIPVALKLLRELGPSPVYRLKNEFRSLADVTHPNLVGLHELFADEGHWFFTMDLVDGVRFDAWVRPAGAGEAPPALDEVRLRAVLPQLLAAVAAIHAAGKLHRDLKPGNVLVTREGRAVVLDFGLVIDPVLGAVGRTIDELEVSGTPAYMAPEQALGVPPTAASDLYALGVMLFEALSGRLPFEGRVHEMLVDKQRGEAPDVRSFAADAPEDLARLAALLLARDPEQRPAAARLRELLGVEAGVAPERASLRPGPPAELPLLLGREAELAALHDAFEAACRGDKPVVVLLAGESGIGKSALTDAFLAELRAQGHAVVLSGRCFERESVPFKGFDAIADELSRYLRRLSLDNVSALLPRDAYALHRLFPVLGRLPPFAHAPQRDVPDPVELRRRAFLALGELLGRIRDRQPLVLHVDDLQWSDADSTLLWMHLLRQPDAPPLLLIASHRVEQMHDHPYVQPLYAELTRDSHLDVRCLRVPPLSVAATRALSERVLGSAPPRLIEEAAGNPFLLQELALHADTRPAALAGDLSLRQLVAERSAALPDQERGLLALLAVAGRPLALSIAAAALGAAARAPFEALRGARLARATGDGMQVECWHDKIREALLQTLDADALRACHRALSRALRAEPSADAEQLAGHLLGAEDVREAAECWLRAAERASHELGFERAARLYQQALEYGRFDAAKTQHIRVARANALAEAGAGGAAAEAFLEALAGASTEQSLLFRQRAAEQLVYAGETERGRALFGSVFRELGLQMPGAQASTLASIVYHHARLRLRNYRSDRATRADPETRQRIDALRRAANVLMRVDTPRGIELGMREALMVLRLGTVHDGVLALARQIMIVALLGVRSAEIARVAALAAELADPDDPEQQGYLTLFRGSTALIGGSPFSLEQAIADLRRSIALSREHAIPEFSYHRSLCEWILAMTRATSGELAPVGAELPAQLDEAWSRNDMTIVPLWAGGVHAFCSLAVGHIAGFEHHLTKASEGWSAREFTIQELNLHDAQWRLQLYRGDVRAAFEQNERFYTRLTQSALRRGSFAPRALTQRGLCAAELAGALGKGSEREALVRLVAQIARRADQPRVRAALACLQQDETAAIAALRSVASDDWRIETFATRRRLGVLLGGEEGRALIAAADAFFRAGGVVDPEHFTALIMPGLVVSRC